MTPSEIKFIMQSIDSRPIHALGQNFLIDQAALKDIVQAAEIKKGEHVLEVGPGLGVLTKELISSGARVTAIERDRKLLGYLEAHDIKRLELVQGDAAKLDWEKLINKKPWKFVSNLPYAITSFALRKALYGSLSPDSVVVLIQKEVAERIMAPARGDKLSLLSLMVWLASDDIQMIRRVPPGAFYPSPKVDSAILRIVPMAHDVRKAVWGIDPEEVMQAAKKGFTHPRKLLFRNLGLDEKAWTQIAQDLGINIKARAEDLSVQQWVELAKKEPR